MESKWSEEDARAAVERWADSERVNEDLALRVYSSRLIGREPTLVLHGGGNTSVKTRLKDDTGEEVDVLCVKGSGWDLGDIEPPGLPAVRLGSLAQLRAREALSDEDMVNAQRTRLLDASSPNPSVETLLHAFLPAKFIDHSHADAVLALVDQPEREAICAEVFGDRFPLVPYVMPGFALAKLAAEVAEAHPDAEGLVLLKHGLFTFADTAKESYERHVRAVDAAERYIATRRSTLGVPRRAVPTLDWARIAPRLRGALGTEGDRQVHYLLHRRSTPVIDAYLGREDLDDVSQRGTPTPDHVIRTKRVPLVLELEPSMDDAAIDRAIDAALTRYRKDYRAYVKAEAAKKGREVVALDPDPRVVLIPGVGMVTVGTTPKAARVAADLHEHCIDVIESAEAVGTYEVLPLGDVFDMEYWSLEQAKLGKKQPKRFDGQVVVITGAASGIGEATARLFAAEGATLFLIDREPKALEKVAQELAAAHVALDVSDASALRAALAQCVKVFGGVDGVVSNAGFAPQGALHTLDDELLQQSFAVNFFAHHVIAQEAVKVMRAQGFGGFILFNASKAAFNPGKDFGPYAIPKAAVIALMKQLALENGEVGIRVNAVNADRIRTGLLPPAFVEERAKARGLDADAYFRSNLLKREVTAEDVAGAFLSLALAKSTTGSVFTVDGGNIAASPR
ncbi:MAG: bifunctional aldolase/short-chain dehydrogenase [Deltaproteobacteria bacterium]|nr:bifunctional aldolase/short-chain dehydrogenase [Deltaproteobacteria bacterium]